MKTEAKRILSLVLAILMVCTLLAACGTPKAANTTEEPKVRQNDTSDDNSNGGDNAAAAKGDGWLDINFGGLTSLTCFLTNGGRDALYYDMMFEPLAMIDADKKLVPVGAASWSTEDKLTYEIVLKENITDSAGNHITASDVVWFVKEAQSQALKPVFNKVASVEQTGEYALSVTLKSEIVGVFEYFMEDTWLISEKAYNESADHFATELISTAAYKVTSFTPSGDMKLERREDYWQPYEDMPAEIRPLVDKVYFHCITEASQVGIALETGLIDYAIDPQISVALSFENNPDYVIEEYPGHQGYQIFFSGYESPEYTSAVANDVKLRQAICYAIDNEGLIDAFAYGHGTKLYDVCPPFYIGYDKDWENEPYYEFDTEKAKQLVAESDYDGRELILLCHSALQRIAEVIQSCCAAAGINIKIYSPESALLMAIRFDGSKYDMFINSIGGTYLPDHWSIRYDPNAYSTGDGTGRHDYALGELLYKTWTVSGYTKENIDAVHEYLRDNAIAYGLFNNNRFSVYSSKITCTEPVVGFAGRVNYFASTWEGI